MKTMIPLKEIREYLEKDAGILEGTLKMMYNHPKTTLALLGAGVIASSLPHLASRIHPAHQILREEQKKRVMKEQTGLLREMLDLQKQNSKPKPKSQKIMTTPLT